MFFVPTGTDNAIDTCDLVIATSSGDDACSVTLLDGTSLLVAAPVDDFAAEVNALYDDGPLVVGPFPLAGGTQTCWIAGQKVQRVQPARDPDECYVSLLSLRSLLLIAAALADVVDLLNTTAGGCGGGGGEAVGGNYANAGWWSPTVTPLAGNDVTPNVSGGAFQTRNGPWLPPPTAPTPQAGDVQQLACQFYCVIKAGVTTLFTVTNLPAPIANGYFTAVTSIRNSGGDTLDAAEFIVLRDSSNGFRVQRPIPMVLETTFVLDCVVTYQVDGV